MKKSTGGLQYVSDFSFPSDQGFTGSAGKSTVKGYQRGGAVKKNMGGFMGPEREIAVDDVTVTVPRAKGGAVHNKLVKHGAKLGFKYGGQVKNTSAEFVAKKGKQDTMDDGVQPARRGRTQQEIEAGGTKRLKPGFAKGGKASKKGNKAEVQQKLANSMLRQIRELKGTKSDYEVQHMESLAAAMGKSQASNTKLLAKMRSLLGDSKPVAKARGGKVAKAAMMGAASSGGGALADAAIKHAKKVLAPKKHAMKAPEKARAASKKGMPENVKMAGGMVHKARGGSVKK
jgi:hypothetical protein